MLSSRPGEIFGDEALTPAVDVSEYLHETVALWSAERCRLDAIVRGAARRDPLDLVAQQQLQKKSHVLAQPAGILARQDARLDEGGDAGGGSRRLDSVFERQQAHDLDQRFGPAQLEIDGIFLGSVPGDQLREQIDTAGVILLQPGNLREERQVVARRHRYVAAQRGRKLGRT